jgi:hypothetical protein
MGNCLSHFGEEEFNSQHNRIKQGTSRIFTIERNGKMDTVIEIHKSPQHGGRILREIKGP